MWRASGRRHGGLRHLKDMARVFAEPWSCATAWLRDGHPVWRVGLAGWNPGAAGRRWDGRSARVTMAGDAVHPMTYQQAQALNRSVTNVGRLVEAIEAIEAMGGGGGG